MDKKTIVLAAGGTGGHVFPAYAVAERLLKEGHTVHLITDERGAEFKNRPKKLSVSILPLARRTHGFKATILLLLSLIPGFFLSFYYLLRFEPSVILGFGGFPSVPTILSAIFLRPFTRHKIILHEQNAVLGRANKKFLWFAQALATSFPNTRGIRKSFQHKVHLAGNPVRPIFRDAMEPYTPLKAGDPIRLLVIGGSQGARSFSTAIPQALSQLPENLRQDLHVVQQSRPELLDATRAAYKKLGIHITAEPFFQNIHELMGKAHLIICRSGSSTVFEVAHTRRPAFYIPFPYAMDNHQYFNAHSIVNLKGGWVLEEKEIHQLSALLKSLLEDPKTLATAAQNVHDLVKKDTLQCFSTLIQTL